MAQSKMRIAKIDEGGTKWLENAEDEISGKFFIYIFNHGIMLESFHIILKLTVKSVFVREAYCG
jgi:hypothetical protein